jgi:hypothetical protein
MRQQAADVFLRIAYQRRIPQMQGFSGQHRVAVIHERQLATVVPTQIIQVITEGLPFGKVLLESAETRIHRVTPHVDDGGIRQDRPDESDLTEIIRHFVDKVRPSAANWPRFVEVTSP